MPRPLFGAEPRNLADIVSRAKPYVPMLDPKPECPPPRAWRKVSRGYWEVRGRSM